MSKSRHHNKNVIEDYEEERRPRRKKTPPPDKRKERRIQRALKTKNVQDFLHYDESIDLDPLEEV